MLFQLTAVILGLVPRIHRSAKFVVQWILGMKPRMTARGANARVF